MTTAKSDITAAKGRLDGAEGRLTTAEASITTASGRLDGAEGRLTANEASITAADGRLDAIDLRLTTAEGKIAANEVAIESNANNIMYNQQFAQNEFNAINAILDDHVDTGTHDISGLITQLA